jgi:DNA-binding response OmpR family regulator
MLETVGKTILLIEDQAEARQEVALALARHGFGVLQAARGREASEWLRRGERRPSLIVLDWISSDVDSQRLLSREADPSRGAIPVVVLSSVSEMRYVPVMWAAVVLAKPVRLITLVGVVSKLCTMSQSDMLAPPPPPDWTIRTGTPPTGDTRRDRIGDVVRRARSEHDSAHDTIPNAEMTMRLRRPRTGSDTEG